MRILIALAILAPLAANAADITGRVTSVTDGDTFRIGDLRIRVCGIRLAGRRPKPPSRR